MWCELPKAVHQEGPGPGLLLETPGWWGPGAGGSWAGLALREHPLCVCGSLSHTPIHYTHTHTPDEGSGRPREVGPLAWVTEPGSRGRLTPVLAPQPLCLWPGPPDLTKPRERMQMLRASPAHTHGCCLPWFLAPFWGS